MITFENSKREYVQVKDCTTKFNTCGLICPYCKNHKQGLPDKYHDCKTIIYKDELDKDGKLVVHSQCMCYSKEHGERE